MKLGEMIVTDKELRKAQLKEKKELLFQELSNKLIDNDLDVLDIALFEEREEVNINYSFRLDDGFSDTGMVIWYFSESTEEVIDKIVKKVLYIDKLRKDYPEYALLNDHIQKHRKYTRNCKLYDTGTAVNAQLAADLCGYLKLPNTTSTGFGGGDYEIKRTPKRVEDFNRNIDTLCLFLSDCIAELRNIKLKEGQQDETQSLSFRK